MNTGPFVGSPARSSPDVGLVHAYDKHWLVSLPPHHVQHPYPDRMAVSARDVAPALRERLPDLGTVKLHKLLYYCQGHHLAIFGEPLFSETISAWDMGPVVGTLWRGEKDG